MNEAALEPLARKVRSGWVLRRCPRFRSRSSRSSRFGESYRHERLAPFRFLPLASDCFNFESSPWRLPLIALATLMSWSPE